jgi:hypothetical protein
VRKAGVNGGSCVQPASAADTNTNGGAADAPALAAANAAAAASAVCRVTCMGSMSTKPTRSQDTAAQLYDGIGPIPTLAARRGSFELEL